MDGAPEANAAADAAAGDAAAAGAAPTWRPIDAAAGLFEIERWNAQRWSLRSVALRLADGSLALVSASRGLGDAAHAALAAIGTPSVLLAPNYFHHLGLAEHVGRYPDAVVVASAVAAPRVARKQGARIGAVAPLRQLAERLPRHVELLEPPGLRTGEVFLRAETAAGTAWIVSDAFMSMAAMPRGAMGLFCRVTGTAPGLRIGGTFTGIAVRDRTAYRRWLLTQLDRDQPRLLVPSHGAILSGEDLAARLQAVAEARL